MVRFNFPNEPVVEWKGGYSISRGRIIYFLKECKMISKGFLYHIVRVQDLDSEVPLIESVPVVSEFWRSSLMTILVFLTNGKLNLALIFYWM